MIISEAKIGFKQVGIIYRVLLLYSYRGTTSEEDEMGPKETILLGLAPAKCKYHSPVQIQKLFFLFEENISKKLGGKVFNFQPYNYGPFDKKVYDVLESLEREEYVEIDRSSRWYEYRLTDLGQEKADSLFEDLETNTKTYLTELSDFILNHSFSELVRAVYKEYPKMRENSVFQG